MNLELGLEGLRRVFTTRRAEEGVDVVDEVHLDVALLPILPDDAMRALVREMLSADGWTSGKGGSMEKSFGGAVATLSADGKTISLRVASETTVAATASVEVAGEVKASEAAQLAERQAKERARVMAERERERLAAENVKALTELEPTLRSEVQRALNRTYRQALETRARQMGQVESINERGDQGGSYEVTVVVKA